MPSAHDPIRGLQDWPCDRSKGLSREKNVFHVRFLQPTSVDVSFFQHTVETSVMADRKKLNTGLSPQELYIKSNPNLLTDDYTNPRNWYNSAAQRNILKSVNFSQNDTVKKKNNNSMSSYFPEGKSSKENVFTKLPRINTQERISGSKSAENIVKKKHFEIEKTFLTRGPSFDEATRRLRKKTPLNLVESTFPPTLGKSISWPEGSQGEAKPYVSRLSKGSRETNPDSGISLPPMNPDTGHPFLPHLPPHQPWVSSGHSKNKTNFKFERRQMRNVPKPIDEALRRNLSLKIGDDQSYANKIEKWFRGIASDATNDSDSCQFYEQLNNNNDYFTAEPHPPKQDHHGYKRQKDVTKIFVPDLKNPVEYDAVFKQLRTDKRDKPDERTAINRHEYKLKQRSSLHLKMVDGNCKARGGKAREIPAKVNVDINKPIQVSTESFPTHIERKKHRTAGRKNATTKADRQTGLKFLLARLPEDSDDDDFSNDDEESMNGTDRNFVDQAQYVTKTVNQTEANNFNGGMPSSGLSESKPAVVNLVLSNERPPQRQPHHIEISMKKMTARIADQSESEDKPKPDPVSVPDTVQETTEPKLTDHSEKTIAYENDTQPKSKVETIGACQNGLVNTTDRMPTTLERRSNSNDKLALEASNENVDQEGIRENGDSCSDNRKIVVDSREVKKSSTKVRNSPESDCTSPEDINKVNTSVTQCAGTSTFTLTYKTDKSALSKYNVLEPFRDKSQPNMVLPTALQVVKPACSEWTHPPTYKLDLRKYNNDNDNHEETEQTNPKTWIQNVT